MPKKNYGRKFLSVLVVLVMLCTSVVGGHVKAANPGSTTVFDKNGLKVDFKVDNQWVGFFNGTMTVKNTGTQPVEDWAITFDFPHEITNIWNAGITEHQQGVYTVKNLEWNQDIPVGDSISFGFTAAVSGNITYPTFFTVNTKTAVVPSALVKVEYVLYSDWGSGYSAALKITNPSQTKIEDWTIDFDFARSISTLSCGKILAHDGTHYTIQNDGSTQNLSAGQTIQLGLVGTGGIASNVPAGSIVKQIVRGFDLVSDTDGDLVLDWVEICVNGTDPLVPDGTTPTPTPTPSATPTPTPPEDMVTDTDGDLIPDYYEAILGTDPTLVDTDADGLSDYDEIFLLGFNPLSTDSDGNGILDYDEDVDHDGLSFRQEAQAGTDSYNKDTDADGLLDGEEINTYGTNPLVADVDGDGLVDGDEIALGLNPLITDTNGNGISDLQEKIQQTVTEKISEEEKPEVTEVTVSMSTAGNIQKTTQIKSVYKVDAQSSDVVGLIGAPVEITSDSTFDEATISFHYDDSQLGDTPEENLAIMWYDKEKDEYIVLDDEDVLDMANNTISYTTTHFSTYMVVDKVAWYAAWRQSLDTMSEARDQYYSSIPAPNFDFVFAIQGNMTQPMRAQATQIACDFIDAMYAGDRCAALCFGEKVGMYLTFESESNSYKLVNTLQNWKNNWASDPILLDLSNDVGCLSHAVTGANYIYNYNVQSNNQKDVIVLSDGVNISPTGGDIEWTEIDYDPTVYVIRLGSTSASDSILQSFAENNGGELLIADTSANIFEAFYEAQQTKMKEQMNTVDADNDGIADIFEITGILLSNGRIVYTDPTKADTDSDGLTDGQEVGTPVSVSTLSSYEKLALSQAGWTTNTKYFYCFKNSSNPKMSDTDGDGYKDNVDPRPLRNDVETVDLKNQSIEKQGYLQIQDFDNNTVFYGGSQMWFDETDYWGNMQDYMIHYFGCGVIAFTDLIAYQEGYRSLYKSVEMDYIRTANDNLPIIGTGIERENNHYGIGPNGVSIVTAINSYYFVSGDSDKASWEWSLDDKEMLEDIRIMLDEDVPVIMSLGPNFPDVLTGTSGIVFYKLYLPGDTDYINTNSMEIYQFSPSADKNVMGHYFTVTGIFKDDISGKTMLRISSWGSEYYIDYSAYRNYANNIGNQATTSIIKMTA